MNPQLSARGYTYAVRWSPREQAYVATVAEFPSLASPPMDFPKKAIEALVDQVAMTLLALDRDSLPRPTVLGISDRQR